MLLMVVDFVERASIFLTIIQGMLNSKHIYCCYGVFYYLFRSLPASYSLDRQAVAKHC